MDGCIPKVAGLGGWSLLGTLRSILETTGGWVGNFWCWNEHKEAWDVAQLVSFKEDPEVTADWMVHKMVPIYGH